MYMHKRGVKKMRETQKDSVQQSAVCVHVCGEGDSCVAVCVHMCVGVLLRDIFNSVCQLLSSPSDGGGKLRNVSNATVI